MTSDDKIATLELVNIAVSDYLMALDNQEFAYEYGGVERFLGNLRFVHNLYEEQFSTIGEE